MIDLEAHRHELHLHCYRMLGSFQDAEDVVQETLLRAWRRQDDRVEHPRAWLYRIATNACLDLIRARGRRPVAAASFADVPWLEPYPDAALDADPHGALVARETIGLTFLAVMQQLPPRQRAVLILREVLGWPAADVAEALGVGVAAVNSALQRARTTLREHLPADRREDWGGEAAPDERAVLAGYISAYERGDAEASLALIRDDIRVTMPPAPYVFEGREAIAGLIDRARDTGRWRLLETAANRQPAAACYLHDGTTFRAFKLDVLRVVGGRVAEVTTFGARHFAAFGLPATVA